MKFSDERELFAAAGMLPRTPPARKDVPVLRSYAKAVKENRWYILLIALVAFLIGGITTVAMPPLYEANLLIQIADSASPSKGFLSEASTAFDIKSPAVAEMEIMRSRMVVAPVAEKQDLLTVAERRLFPLVGSWHGNDPDILTTPGVIRIGNWVHGAQSITVRQFDVPPAAQNKPFILRIEGDGRYSLRHAATATPIQGKVGEILEGKWGTERFSLLVSQLRGDKGAEFSLQRKSAMKATENLQETLKLVERGRQSGVIEATFRDADPRRAAAVLNAIGANYVRQDLDRKSAEAEKALQFLNSHLPTLKQQMDKAEGEYNKYRSRRGTINSEDEAKVAIERTADIRARLADAQQRKRDMMSQMGSEHPAVRIVDQQIAGLQGELRAAQGSISAMPSTQLDTQRLEREVKSTSDLYNQLRSSAMQLQLVKEGRSGNARIIDQAIPPDDPVRPKASINFAVAAAGAVVLSLLLIMARSGLSSGVRNPRDIEAGTGLNVYSSVIPHSRTQGLRRRAGKVLAVAAPADEATVGLRQLHTLLQHQLRDRPNNRLLITGPTQDVGVRFIISNLGAVAAMAGKRVLLIDLDRGHGSLHKTFGIAGVPGLAELMAGNCTRREAMRSTGIPRLELVTAGTGPSDFKELSSSPVFLDLLEIASREYDLVLLAAPPVLRSPETLSLAASAAMVVLVARAGKTATEDLAESARRLSQAGQYPSGVALNGV